MTPEIVAGDEGPLPNDRMQMMFGQTKDATDKGGDAMIEMVVATVLAMTDDQRQRLATRMAQLENTDD